MKWERTNCAQVLMTGTWPGARVGLARALLCPNACDQQLTRQTAYGINDVRIYSHTNFLL